MVAGVKVCERMYTTHLSFILYFFFVLPIVIFLSLKTLILSHSNKTQNNVWLSAYPEFSNCEIVAIPAKYDFKPYGWGFQKDSPFLEMFNYYLDEMREKGANKQIFVKYNPPIQV